MYLINLIIDRNVRHLATATGYEVVAEHVESSRWWPRSLNFSVLCVSIVGSSLATGVTGTTIAADLDVRFTVRSKATTWKHTYFTLNLEAKRAEHKRHSWAFV